MIFNLFKKKQARPKAKDQMPAGELIGEITHYFSRAKAGVVKLKKPLAVNDTVYIKGHTTDLKQKISSLQIDNKPVDKAVKGKDVGFAAKKRLRSGDKVYKL
jgi:hypothetical protein